MKLKDPKEIIANAYDEGRKWLLEPEAKEICKSYNIPVPKYIIVHSEDDAIEAANKIGYPVVMKIISKDIIHKSDVGGVVVGIYNDDEVRRGYRNILKNIKNRLGRVSIEGFLVEEMARKSTEVIVGMTIDKQFGKIVMFGLGGIFVEVFKDVSFRMIPLEYDDAVNMIKEIKAYPILEGYRGTEPADINTLANIILNLSKIALDYDEIREIDLNPIFTYSNGALAVDARIILK